MEYETNENQSAFPSTRDTQTWGLTKRELFAAMALQGMLANPNLSWAVKDLALDAVESADHLIERLNAESITDEN